MQPTAIIRGPVLFAATLMSLVCASPAASADACQALLARAGALDSSGYRGAFDEAGVVCPGAVREKMGQMIAVELWRANAALEPSADTVPEVVTHISYFGRVWQALRLLGDYYRITRQFDEAAKAYSEALSIVRDESVTPERPPIVDLLGLRRQVEIALNLAGAPVAVAGTRAAQQELETTTIRGIEVEPIARPVPFDTNSTVLTQDGQRIADTFVDLLRRQNTRSVVIVGHADERGSHELNDDLSLGRAQAIERYLVARLADLPGLSISALGRGKREPYGGSGSDSLRQELGQQSYWQLCRRVEIKLQ